jgi:hypothetical protein
MTDPVLEGLTKRRNDLVVEVRRMEVRFQDLLANIDQLDAAIIQFDPAYRPHHPAVRTVKSLPLTRTLLTILRKSPEPMKMRDLTIAMMESLGLDHRNAYRVTRLTEQVRTALTRQKKNGVVMSEAGPNRTLIWRIAG